MLLAQLAWSTQANVPAVFQGVEISSTMSVSTTAQLEHSQTMEPALTAHTHVLHALEPTQHALLALSTKSSTMANATINALTSWLLVYAHSTVELDTIKFPRINALPAHLFVLPAIIRLPTAQLVSLGMHSTVLAFRVAQITLLRLKGTAGHATHHAMAAQG